MFQVDEKKKDSEKQKNMPTLFGGKVKAHFSSSALLQIPQTSHAFLAMSWHCLPLHHHAFLACGSSKP